MSIFSKIFGARSAHQDNPDIHFGRYSDAYKPAHKYDAWDRSVAHYEAREYHSAWKAFFEYLSDDDQENVTTFLSDKQLEFELLQGSKKIIGSANDQMIRASAKIVKAQAKDIGLLRQLIADNYNLKFGRYSLDDEGDISIVFDSLTVDASPYKLYYGLKEIALAADKQDDLLLEEFEQLSPVNDGHIDQIPVAERKLKAAFISHTIHEVLKEVHEGRLDANQYPGGITYLLLDTIYKLDFLTRPEGYTMEAFERMHRSYFAADGFSQNQKNHFLIRELQKVCQRPLEKLEGELYRTTATFGIISATQHQKFREIVEGELHNMDWYEENHYEEVALAIPGYIVGHALFYYSLPEADRELFLLYYQIMEPSFFSNLGFQNSFVSADGSLNKGRIRAKISQIIAKYRDVHPYLMANLKALSFADRLSFAKSYLRMIAGLDLRKNP